MRGFELPDKTPRTTSMEAVELLRDLLNRAPDHPGVHHYVIHGFEGSTFAKDAWPSCKRYSELVTNIPHALHMPGHIYSQTGRWADAEKSFSDAAVNERGYMKADALYGSGHHGHNVHYLATSLSFQGKYPQAMAAAQRVTRHSREPARKGQSGWFLFSLSTRLVCHVENARFNRRTGTRFWMAHRFRNTTSRANRLGGTGRAHSLMRQKAMWPKQRRSPPPWTRAWHSIRRK